MAKIESISIPSNSVTVLRPASLHIMIFKLPKETKADQQFTLRLNFKKSGSKTVLIKIADSAGSAHHNPM
jgi:copper(I)-binding protein